MDKCAKCGRPDDGWLVASVDVNDMLCINCSDRFNEWCDTHPGEPYQNFLEPKPWEPKSPALIRIHAGGTTTTFMPPSEDELFDIYAATAAWADVEDAYQLFEMYGYMCDDVEKTRELLFEKLGGPIMPEHF